MRTIRKPGKPKEAEGQKTRGQSFWTNESGNDTNIFLSTFSGFMVTLAAKASRRNLNVLLMLKSKHESALCVQGSSVDCSKLWMVYTIVPALSPFRSFLEQKQASSRWPCLGFNDMQKQTWIVTPLNSRAYFSVAKFTKSLSSST